MSQYFIIHPHNPEQRLIKQASKILQEGGVIAYPTDSAYALGCMLQNKKGSEVIRQIRKLDTKHNFTLMCRDLSEISVYATIDNVAFRFLKGKIPGPYTFILKASKEVPKRLMHPKRSTIGLRIPDNKIAQALLKDLDAPLMSVSLILPEDEYPIIDAEEINNRIGRRLDLIIDGGSCGIKLTTVVDLSGDVPQVIRIGKGEI